MTTKRAIIFLLLLAAFGCADGVRADDAPITAQIQRVVDDYLAQRRDAENISGVSLYISLGDPGPVIEAFAGDNGRDKKVPIDGDTLFQIGSNSKHFEAAVVLALEAEERLDIEDTVGYWLPEYPAWHNVTIRQLLQMTSPIPNYSETVAIGQIMGSDPFHQFIKRELIAAAYPRPDNRLPIPSGWFYSNTNNILAALIVEKASRMSFKEALEKFGFQKAGLHNSFYEEGIYPDKVLDRVPRGLYENAACLDYQPVPCTRSLLAPLIGRDMSGQNLSWAGAAGAIVSNPRDLAKWVRGLFGGRIIPQKQLREMTTLVSQHTGEPVKEATQDDPLAFGLDVAQVYRPNTGRVWFYEGITLGFRVIFAYWPQHDLVITAATNSQPPEGENRLGDQVVAGAFDVLVRAGMIKPAPPQGPLDLPGGDPE
jgi:D-alanyl-D-alanine carboxypeptidase